MNQALETYPDIPEIVRSLAALKIERITKSFIFKTCTHYQEKTEILLKNEGNVDCYVVPGGLYFKQVLIEFEALDASGKQCVFVPSGINDTIILKYLFFKLLNQYSAIDNHQLILYNLFVKDNSDASTDYISGVDLLSLEFETDFSRKFFEAMWKTDKKICDLIEEPIDKYVSSPKLASRRRISELFTDELKDFCRVLDNYFFQLIQLNGGIKPNSYYKVQTTDNKFTPERHKKLPLPEKYTFSLDFETLLPYQGNPSFHVEVLPPEGVKLEYKPNWLTKGESIGYWKELEIDEHRFTIIHSTEAYQSDEAIKEANISESKCTSLLKRIDIQSESREDVSSQSSLQEDIAFMYFGQTRNDRRKQEDLCKERHELLVSLNLKDKAIVGYHLFVLALLPILYIISYLVIFSPELPFVVKVSPYFWSLVISILVQSIAVVVYYSNRPPGERFFLKPVVMAIAVLTVIEFILLIILPVTYGILVKTPAPANATSVSLIQLIVHQYFLPLY